MTNPATPLTQKRSVSFPPKLKDQIELAAEQDGVSFSEQVRVFCERGLTPKSNMLLADIRQIVRDECEAASTRTIAAVDDMLAASLPAGDGGERYDYHDER